MTIIILYHYYGHGNAAAMHRMFWVLRQCQSATGPTIVQHIPSHVHSYNTNSNIHKAISKVTPHPLCSKWNDACAARGMHPPRSRCSIARRPARRIPLSRAPQAEAAARHPPQQQRRQRSKMPRAEAARREHTAAGLVIKARRIVSVTVCSAPALSEERWLVPGW